MGTGDALQGEMVGSGSVSQLRSGIGIAASVLCGALLVAAQLRALGHGGEPRPIARHDSGGYRSSDACRSCHPSQYDSWRRSFHRTMTQLPDAASVRGDFGAVELELDGERYDFFEKDGRYWVRGLDPLWAFVNETGTPIQVARATVTRPIALVTGSHHMQVYWVESGVGNQLLSLPFTWLIDEARWVPRRDTFLSPPGAGQRTAMWNTGCIFCHATAGRPGLELEPFRLESRVGEETIGCESCHGPGATHVTANQNPLRRYRRHVSGGGDPTVVNPARLTAERASQVCAQCHALLDRFSGADPGFPNHGSSYRPGGDLLTLAPLERASDLGDPTVVASSYWPDGECRISGREYSALAASACMQSNELSCLSCHSMHRSDPDDQLAHGKAGDGACLGCHAELERSAALEAHTHHSAASEGSRCQNCHMPYTTYGLLKAIRSHRISSPAVDVSTPGARPNACNLCHLDRPLGWTAEHLSRWYGAPLPVLSERDRTIAAAVVWLLAGDAVQRAVVAWNAGWEPARNASRVDLLVPYLAHLLVDPYAAVRRVAWRSLRSQPAHERLEYDPSGSLDAQLRAREKVLRAWSAAERGAAPALLIGADGQVADEAALELLSQRDDTPINSME